MTEKIEPIDIVFADKHAEISYRIAAAVEYLDSTLPLERNPEGTADTLKPIMFNPEAVEQGEAALFYANDFMNAYENEDEDKDENQGKTVYFIRRRTQRILDTLKIEYSVVSSSESFKEGADQG